MIYFDNAATGGFKPYSVKQAVASVEQFLLANPGRSGHRLSVAGEKIVYKTRELLAKNLNALPERIIFTKNCTESLNLAIFGSLKVGGNVITTTFEHNSVLRPLNYLKQKGLITLDIVRPEKNLALEQAIEEKITSRTYLVVATASSNVTGECFNYNKIARICKKHNILFLCDFAQAGGHLPIKINGTGISFGAFAPHKGLYGIMGSGFLAINKNADLNPLIFGGTGTESFNLNQPQNYPEKLESGTLNLPAIAGLYEGADYAFKNMEIFSDYLKEKTLFLINELSKIKGISVYSKSNSVGIVSFCHFATDSIEFAEKLNSDYDIGVRGGFHCAPLTHKFLKTDKAGLVRVSISPHNTTKEILTLIKAIKQIVKD